VLFARHEMAVSGAEEAAREVDHRGVVLPKKHRAGGIITPQ